MMSIEEEILHLQTFLSHPCGFEVSLYGTLQIRPIDESCLTTEWEVSWKELQDGIEIDYYKEFHSLYEACQCFVEKRHYMCFGSDFQEMMVGAEPASVEISNE
jgi:hypothetical protein